MNFSRIPPVCPTSAVKVTSRSLSADGGGIGYHLITSQSTSFEMTPSRAPACSAISLPDLSKYHPFFEGIPISGLGHILSKATQIPNPFLLQFWTQFSCLIHQEIPSQAFCQCSGPDRNEMVQKRNGQLHTGKGVEGTGEADREMMTLTGQETMSQNKTRMTVLEQTLLLYPLLLRSSCVSTGHLEHKTVKSHHTAHHRRGQGKPLSRQSMAPRAP